MTWRLLNPWNLVFQYNEIIIIFERKMKTSWLKKFFNVALRKLYNFTDGKVSWKLLGICQTMPIQFIRKLFSYLWWQRYANIYFIGKLYVLQLGLMARSCNCCRKYSNWSLALKATLKCVTSKIYSTLLNSAVCLALNKSRTCFCYTLLPVAHVLVWL